MWLEVYHAVNFFSLFDSFLEWKYYTANICQQSCNYVFISYLLHSNILTAFISLFGIFVLAKYCFSKYCFTLFVCVVDLGELRGFFSAMIILLFWSLVCFSLEECGRYLETIKVYENKPADIIQGHMDADYLSRVCIFYGISLSQ